MKKIDFVITWVNGNDLRWKEKKDKYLNKYDKKLNTNSRFRDWEILKYWFRSVEKNAPWVNNIYFITEGHLPEWLNLNHKKLKIINHSDYISHEFLPTFNSNVIELNINKIKGISNCFVLFNDDMFINDIVKESDFFVDGVPRDIGVFAPQIPIPGGISSITLNNVEIINKYFNTRKILKKNINKFYRLSYHKHIIKNLVVLFWKDVLGFYDHHLPISYNMSTFNNIWDLERETIINTCKNKFRTKTDINHWLMRYWQIATGNFVPRSTKFGCYYNIDESIDVIIDDIKLRKHKLICLNDGDNIVEFDKLKEKLINVFEERYNEKSSFEK